MTQSREAGLKVAHTLAQNYATLVSGVLIGLSEAMVAIRFTPPVETHDAKFGWGAAN